ncbi:MAG: hypothetical protein LQ350_001909 [Teloschistes chrysophthalmus]|nr:MAG: hypothetical protein LQ350_001909 [Niorma chrysophthalma]
MSDSTPQPPEALKIIYKSYQKASIDALAGDPDILDFSKDQQYIGHPKVRLGRKLDGAVLEKAFALFSGSNRGYYDAEPKELVSYEHDCVSDLANPKHKTNIHLHHVVPYDNLSTNLEGDVTGHGTSQDLSFFNIDPFSSLNLLPINPDIHKPLSIAQFLNRKLRWMTLGGQYDWTKKVYPTEVPPEFPKDVAALIRSIFPLLRPEAAIVNIYSPGDTLSIHRDVSESSDAGLVSISIGCDAIFIAGLEDPSSKEIKHAVVRLRSGDAVYMTGPSRFAWHGVPQILANTCPWWLSAWPAGIKVPEAALQEDSRFEAWRGWMANKRINLNVRQMTE